MSVRVRSELLEIGPLDAVDKAHLAGALAWVESGAPVFRLSRPATPPAHLLAHFAVVDDANNRRVHLHLPVPRGPRCRISCLSSEDIAEIAYASETAAELRHFSCPGSGTAPALLIVLASSFGRR